VSPFRHSRSQSGSAGLWSHISGKTPNKMPYLNGSQAQRLKGRADCGELNDGCSCHFECRSNGSVSAPIAHRVVTLLLETWVRATGTWRSRAASLLERLPRDEGPPYPVRGGGGTRRGSVSSSQSAAHPATSRKMVREERRLALRLALKVVRQP